MTIGAALLALLQLAPKLLDLFIKTPEQKITDVNKAILQYVEDMGAAVKLVNDDPGNTKSLEDVINRRGRA